jgi:hypothetical protein
MTCLHGALQLQNALGSTALTTNSIAAHASAGVYKNGGPTNVDGPKDLSGICDRSDADVRGIKKSISAVGPRNSINE